MKKENIQNIKNCFYKNMFLGNSYEECIDWAINQLELGNTDESICILAGLHCQDHWEIKNYIQKIIGEELVDNQDDNETWAGKYIIILAEKLKNKEIDIFELDRDIGVLHYKLGYPTWLDMLSRNCEYATDIEQFEKPFKEELDYIVNLWKNCNDVVEFRKLYDRKVSQSHDWKFSN